MTQIELCKRLETRDCRSHSKPHAGKPKEFRLVIPKCFSLQEKVGERLQVVEISLTIALQRGKGSANRFLVSSWLVHARKRLIDS